MRSRVQIVLEIESAYDCVDLHCTVPFIVISPLSRYEINNVEKDVKDSIIGMKCQK